MSQITTPVPRSPASSPPTALGNISLSQDGSLEAAGKPVLGSIVDPAPQQNAVSNPVSNRKKTRVKATSVVTTTPSSTPSEHDKLVDGAVKAAALVNGLIKSNADQVENGSRNLIRLMLIVRESFMDEAAFWKFVNHRAGPARGKVTNQWQRLAKACVPKETKRPQVSKYGYVLAALMKEDIGSEAVMEEFELRESVAGSDRSYTGMDRFVRLYKAENAGPPKDENPFSNMNTEKLQERAEFLIDALRERHMLNPQITDVSDLVEFR